MKFTDLFIKRPILSIVICVIIFLLGLIGCFRLPIRMYPKVDSSVITITTTYPGASPEIMANFVTAPLEDAISGTDGVDYITSQSQYSTSTITVNLTLGYDINAALSDINTEVSSALWQLPSNINNPVIQKNDPNATPTYYLTFASKTAPLVEIGNFVTNNIKPIISGIPGVGQAMIYGANEYAMRLWLNPKLMAARNITATDILTALQNNNVQATAGQIKTDLQQFDVYANTDLHTPAQFNDLVIKQKGQQITRISDVGYATLGAQNDDYSVFMDGKPSISIGVIPKSDANPLTVAAGVKKRLAEIKRALPSNISLVMSYDMSQYISNSIYEVISTLVEAFIIVFLVVFIILGSWRSVIVPVVAIPLSIVGACFLLYLFGYSFNTLTLLAFVLAIGLVVDDAIVVTENVHRHLVMGQAPIQAAINGAREIRFAVIAMTLTLAAAYMPVAFATGLTGILFREFALTLACTVIISGIVALVLSPMMCSRVMTLKSCQSGFSLFMEKVFEWINIYYRRSLEFLIKIRWIVLIIALCIYAIGILCLISMSSALAPPEDQGFLMGLAKGPASANLTYTENHSEQIAQIYEMTPAVEHNLIINGIPYGVNSALTVAILKPWTDRKVSAMQLMYQWYPKMWAIPGIMAYPFNPPSLPGSSGFNPVEFVLKSTIDYPQLYKISQKFMLAAEKWGGLTNVDSDLKIDKASLNLNVNRNLAANLGIPMSSVANTLSVFLGQPIAGWFSMDGKSYQVIPELTANFRDNPDDLNYLYLRTNTNKLVPLGNIATISNQISPRTLNRFQSIRSATITAGLAPGVSIGDALAKLNEIAKQTLPKNVSVDYAGQSRQFVEASGKMAQIFIFAVIFIYLILCAQFESFVDPLIVMLSVPLSLTGALIFLRGFHVTLNIYTEIGLVSLLGLMAKQAILIVEFANQLQEKGKAFKEAILEGACERFRPIVMTSLAMVLGAFPLLFASGSGAVSRFQMGLTIVTGLAIGTVLTLFIIPVMYDIFADKKRQASTQPNND